jgi:hypothetical protein
VLTSNDSKQAAQALQTLGRISVVATFEDLVDWPTIIGHAIRVLIAALYDSDNADAQSVMTHGLEAVKLTLTALHDQHHELFKHIYEAVVDKLLPHIHMPCSSEVLDIRCRGIALLYELCSLCPSETDIATHDDESYKVPYVVNELTKSDLTSIRQGANRIKDGNQCVSDVLKYILQAKQLQVVPQRTQSL